MTIRSVILGLLAGVALASVGYVNDIWLSFPAVGGNLMPTYAYGVLMLGLLVVNPLLRLLGRWHFKSSELVVIVSLVLMGSVIGGSGLMWVFPHPLVTPLWDYMEIPGWRVANLVQYVPPVMLVDADPGSEVVRDYMQGLAGEGRTLPVTRVPWGSWAPTLGFWFSVLGLNFIAGLAAVVVVHRQWSKRELLALPIASVTDELVAAPAPGRLFNDTLRGRGFWMGFCLAFGVLGLNGLHAWWPEIPAIPLGINFTPLRDMLGAVGRVPWVNVLNVRFYFTVVGLAFLLTSEVSLSIGLSGWLYVLAAAPPVAAGVDIRSDVLGGGLPSFMYFGAYVALAVVVLYLGRRFYWSLLRRVAWLGGRADVLPREVTACRILILATAALVGLLCWVGLHPLLALAFVLMTGMLFLMVGRINAATGLFIIQPFWQPVAVLLAIFGPFALGPHALIMLAMLSVVVTIDPRIAAVPLAINALRVGELQKLRPGRLAGWMGAGIIIAMVVGVLVTVYLLYDLGVSGVASGGTRWALIVARMPFQLLKGAVNELGSMDALQDASRRTDLGRLFASATPAKHFYLAAGIGFAMVLVCYWLRLRFRRWPLHPMLFLVWGSRWTTEFAPSFLLAWFIKGRVMRYGGMAYYRRARGFFIGMMAGEFTAGILWGLIAVAYYLFTGSAGPSFTVTP